MLAHNVYAQALLVNECLGTVGTLDFILLFVSEFRYVDSNNLLVVCHMLRKTLKHAKRGMFTFAHFNFLSTSLSLISNTQ